MNLRQIETFRAVFSSRSITKAAESLFVTPPGVSRMMKHLELQLGVRLFVRANGRISPTADAIRLAAEVDRFYGGVERIRHVAKGLKLGEGQRISIACSPSIGLTVAPKAVARFAAKFPQVEVEFSVQPIVPILDRVAACQCDLALSLVPVTHAAIEQRALASIPVVAVIPSSWPLASEKRIKFAQLAALPYVAFANDSVQGEIIARLLADAGINPTARITTRVAADACRFVQLGLGFALIDALTASAFDGRELVARALPIRMDYNVTAIWAAERPLSGLQEKFLREIVSELSEFPTLPTPRGRLKQLT